MEDAFSSFGPADAAGLELDLGQAEQPSDRPLGDVDVLDPVERDRAMGAAEDAAVDPDFVRADPKFEAAPVEEHADGEEQQQRDRRR